MLYVLPSLKNVKLVSDFWEIKFYFSSKNVKPKDLTHAIMDSVTEDKGRMSGLTSIYSNKCP